MNRKELDAIKVAISAVPLVNGQTVEGMLYDSEVEAIARAALEAIDKVRGTGAPEVTEL